MTARCHTFSHAIVRRPGASVVDGLRAADTGVPDLTLFNAHHAAYVAALRSTAAEVIELESMEDFPDSVFIEDAALCLQEAAVLMRPGAPSRLGEAQAMRPALSSLYENVLAIESPGCIEGGDILTTEAEILVGRSARTDAEGIAQLARLVAGRGYKVREVLTPPGVLHFKTDCSLLDAETILSTPRLAASGCFSGYRVVHTPDGEEAAANAIRFNELVILAAGFPRTADILNGMGYTVHEIGNSEAAKLDGGMSCLSLRFTPSAKRSARAQCQEKTE